MTRLGHGLCPNLESPPDEQELPAALVDYHTRAGPRLSEDEAPLYGDLEAPPLSHDRRAGVRGLGIVGQLVETEANRAPRIPLRL